MYYKKKKRGKGKEKGLRKQYLVLASVSQSQWTFVSVTCNDMRDKKIDVVDQKSLNHCHSLMAEK